MSQTNQYFFYTSSSPEPSTTPPLIPMNSRAFLFGDHAYEVIRTYDGTPFGVKCHYERMLATLSYLKYGVFPAYETLCRDLMTILYYARSTRRLNDELYIRLHFGRSADAHISLQPDHNLKPIWVYACAPLKLFAHAVQNDQGLRYSLSPYWRNHARCFSPNAKTGNYLNNMLGCIDAKERGFDDAVFINPEDHSLCEGSTFNIAFMDRDGTLVFPDPMPEPPYLLGITQRVITDGTGAPPWRYEKISPSGAAAYPYALALSSLREFHWIAQIDTMNFQKPPEALMCPILEYFHNEVSKDIRNFRDEMGALTPMPPPAQKPRNNV